MVFVLASRNEHKVAELSELLSPHELTALPAEVELPPEDGETFIANALGKARAASAATGRPVVADDSGIEAAALGGAPGVRSARFAGENASDDENLSKLLGEVPPTGDLAVAYVCALVAVGVGEGELIAEERCAGRLTHEPRGSGGFGYDPAFVPAEGDGLRTMAELAQAEKDKISHRGRASRALLAQLREAGSDG